MTAATLDARGFAALVRPRIVVLVMVESAAGFLLADPTHFAPLLWLALGTGLVAAAGAALNHWMEREADARMPRTQARPLVTGALSPRAVWVGGLAAFAAGLAVVALGCGLTAAAIELAAGLVYLGIYTPLKPHTSANTWIGAIPGALPVLAGAAAAGNATARLPLIVFALIFLWQLPHFFAIASMYRDDYRSGGMRMLSDEDPVDELLRWQMPIQVMSVVLVSLLPFLTDPSLKLYLAAALVLGAFFLRSAFRFRTAPEPARARGVVLASVTYLPLVLLALVVDTSCIHRGAGAAQTPRDSLGVLPEFQLTDETGAPFGRADMLGEPWIVDFVFTRCAGECVPMTTALVALQREDLPVRFLSVTVDPTHDGPDELTAFRSKWEGDAGRWKLATGSIEDVTALCEGGFRLPLGADPDATSLEGLPAIFHSGKLVLVDGAGAIVGYYDHDDVLDLDHLRRDAAALSR